jgi:hypothetical protein
MVVKAMTYSDDLKVNLVNMKAMVVTYSDDLKDLVNMKAMVTYSDDLKVNLVNMKAMVVTDVLGTVPKVNLVNMKAMVVKAMVPPSRWEAPMIQDLKAVVVMKAIEDIWLLYLIQFFSPFF